MEHILIVLGGGLSSSGRLTEKISDRVKLASRLSHRCDAVIFSSRYTLNTPQKLDSGGFVLFEAAIMANYFKILLPNTNCDVYLELSSTDTIGSALFTRQLLESMDFYPKKITINTVF